MCNFNSRPSGTITRKFFVPQNRQLLSLHTWELLNNPSEIESFQKKLQTMSHKLEELPRERSTMHAYYIV